MFGYLVLIFLFLLVMMLASGVLMEVMEEWAEKVKKHKLLWSSVILGLVAALPELALVIAGIVSQTPRLALGAIIGANLANLGVVIGVMSLMAGTIVVVGEFVAVNLWVSITLGLLPLLAMIDGVLSRLDGILLLFGYLVYLNFVIKAERHDLKQLRLAKRVFHKEKDLLPKSVSGMLIFILSFTVLVISAVFLLKTTKVFGLLLETSDYWLGMVFMSLILTLPEVLVAMSLKDKTQTLLTVEKVLGSVVTNSTLIIGVLAIVKPTVVEENLSNSLAGIFLVLILGLFWLFTKSKKKLERWEGLVLFGVYLMFLGLQLLWG